MKGLNEACIDAVDGDAENHNHHILGHRFREGVAILNHHGHVGRRHIHDFKTTVQKRHFKKDQKKMNCAKQAPKS